MKYFVRIYEERYCDYEVEADNDEEAKEKAAN